MPLRMVGLKMVKMVNYMLSIFYHQKKVVFFVVVCFLINLFIYLLLAVLGLRCGVRASHCGGFSCCGAWALGAWASVVAAHGLSSCGSRA